MRRFSIVTSTFMSTNRLKGFADTCTHRCHEQGMLWEAHLQAVYAGMRHTSTQTETMLEKWTAGMGYTYTHRNHVGKTDIRNGIHMYAQKLFRENGHQAWNTHVCTETVSESWTSGAGHTCCHGTAARGEGEHQQTVEVCPRPGGYAPHA